MRQNTVYLAGPITGKDYCSATDWRLDFSKNIKSINPSINTLDPMRGKSYLASLKDIPANGNEKFGFLSGGKAILARDYADVHNSDIIVVNLLGADRVSIGTLFECAWAFSAKIPLILVIEDTVDGKEVNPNAHSMLLAMPGYRVSSLSDAETIVAAFFS